MSIFPTVLDTFTTHANGDVIQPAYDNAQQVAISALETKVGIDGSAVTTSHDYKLSGITGSDKSASLAGTESLTNKSLGAGSKVVLGSDATGDIYYRHTDGTLKRLPIGTSNYILNVNSGVPAWRAETAVVDGSYAAKGILQGLTDEGTSHLTISSGVISVKTGTSAGNVVALDGSAKLPAVDGSALTGVLTSMSTGSQLFASNNTSGSETGTSYVKHKSITVYKGGVYRVDFALGASGPVSTAYGRIYVNGSAVGTERTESAGPTVFSENITVATGDEIQIYIKDSGGGGSAVLTNFRLYVERWDGSLNSYDA